MEEAAMHGADLLNQQFGFQYFAQGHFNMQQKVAGNRISDLLITSRPVLPVLHDTQVRGCYMYVCKALVSHVF